MLARQARLVWTASELALGPDRELRPGCAAHWLSSTHQAACTSTRRSEDRRARRVRGGGVRDQIHPDDAERAALAEAMLAVLAL